MILKYSDNPILEDNPSLAHHPILSRLEDKHLRWICLYMDPWSPLRFMDDEKAKIRTMQSMVPGVVPIEGTWRPNDADVLLWPKALEAFADLCPDIEIADSIAARRNLIKGLRDEESWNLPDKPNSVDLQRHKARLDSVHRKILSKSLDELEQMYGRLQYKPVISSGEVPEQKEAETGRAPDRSHVDNISFK